MEGNNIEMNIRDLTRRMDKKRGYYKNDRKINK